MKPDLAVHELEAGHCMEEYRADDNGIGRQPIEKS